MFLTLLIVSVLIESQRDILLNVLFVFQREKIEWYKDGSKLSSLGNGRFRISSIKTKGGWVSTIAIEDFNKHDIGTFKLYVENGKANIERQINVVVAT